MRVGASREGDPAKAHPSNPTDESDHARGDGEPPREGRAARGEWLERGAQDLHAARVVEAQLGSLVESDA
jgi:hypothetical protein